MNSSLRNSLRATGLCTLVMMSSVDLNGAWLGNGGGGNTALLGGVAALGLLGSGVGMLLRAKQVKRLKDEHGKTLHLRIDDQYDFSVMTLALLMRKAAGYIGLGVSGADDVFAANENFLTEQSRRAFMQVGATKDWHPSDHISFSKNDTIEPIEEPRGFNWPKHGVQGTKGADLFVYVRDSIMARIPLLRSLVQMNDLQTVEKGAVKNYESYSPLKKVPNSTDLEKDTKTTVSRLKRGVDLNNYVTVNGVLMTVADYYRQAGVKRIVLTGLAFDKCVYSSWEDAIASGFDAVCVINASRAIGDIFGHTGDHVYQRAYAKVMVADRSQNEAEVGKVLKDAGKAGDLAVACWTEAIENYTGLAKEYLKKTGKKLPFYYHKGLKQQDGITAESYLGFIDKIGGALYIIDDIAQVDGSAADHEKWLLQREIAVPADEGEKATGNDES